LICDRRFRIAREKTSGQSEIERRKSEISMSSIKCPQCNLTNFKSAVACKRCGHFFQSPPESITAANDVSTQTSFGGGSGGGGQNAFAASSAGHQQSAGFAPTPQAFDSTPNQNHYYQRQQLPPPYSTHYQNYQAPKLKSGLAITSMVLGLVGCLLTAPIGLILGIIAVVKANRYPREYGGKGFAIAGIALNSLGLLFVPIILAIAIPNLLAARRAANEASAIRTVRTLAQAEQSYMTSMSGKCGDIQSLIAGKLIDVSLANNEKNGYRFMVVNFPAGGCEIHATPLTTSHGTRSFYYSTLDETIRAADKKGLAADANDLPLDSGFSDTTGQPQSAAESDNETPWGQPPSERGAMANLRTLHAAQMTYAATAGNGNCTDFAGLAREKLIKTDLADGISDGYRFAVKNLTPYGCELTATPISKSYSSRSFFVGADGAMRGKAKNGLPADKNDPPVN
jgi:type II secretory pathway pseudopilin PulG